MIDIKPKMLFSTLLVMILLAGSLVGCSSTGENGKTKRSDITPLTVEELNYFNSSEFFNGEYINIRNQFLSSLYDTPKKIDLYELFYCGSGQGGYPTEAEIAAVVAQSGGNRAPECGCDKISGTDIDAVLTKYTGLTLDDTDKTGLDKFIYLKEYDAYYHFHGDTNYRAQITFSSGEREGDIIRLFYNDAFMADGNKVLTLRKTNDGYLFISNKKAVPPTRSDAGTNPSAPFGQAPTLNEANSSLNSMQALREEYFEFAIKNRLDYVPIFDEGKAPTSSAEYLLFAFAINLENWGDYKGIMTRDYVEWVILTHFKVENITHVSLPRVWDYDGDKYIAIPGSIQEKPIYVLKEYNTHIQSGQTIYEIILDNCSFGDVIPKDQDMANIKASIISGDLSSLTVLHTEYFKYYLDQTTGSAVFLSHTLVQ